MDQLTNKNPIEFDYLKLMLEEPEFVTGASTSFKIVEEMPKEAFAHPFAREFPMVHPGDVYNSKIYLEAYAHTMDADIVDQVNTSLHKAAEFLGVDKKHFEVIELAANVAVKAASANREAAKVYGLTYEKEGKPINVYPLNDVQDVIDSSIKLSQDRHKIPADWFFDTCKAVIKQAKILEIDEHLIPAIITRLGVNREFCEKSANAGLSQRINIAKERAWGNDEEFDTELVELYTDAFDTAKTATSEEERRPLLAMISDLDHTFNIPYGDRFGQVMDPFQAFYGGMETTDLDKLAASYVFIGDAHVPVVNFLKVTEETLTEEFPEKIANLIKLAQETAKTGFEAGNIGDVAKAGASMKELDGADKSELLTIILHAA